MGYYYNREYRVKEQAKKFLEFPKETCIKLQHQYPRKEVEQRQNVYNDSMSQVIKEAKEFAKKWGKTIDDVRLEHYHYNDYGSDSSALDLTVNGLETDDQYLSRLWETHYAATQREEHERKEFERLKTKFDK